jgi:hypothetical protein
MQGFDSQERLSGYQGRLIKNRKGGKTNNEIEKVVN